MPQSLIKKEICDQYSDVEIVEKTMSDVNFLSCLYQRYENKMIQYIKRISACSQEEAEDILQDVFLNVWIHLKQYRPDVKFSSWLYRITHNETISHWRKLKSLRKQKLMHNIDINRSNDIDQRQTEEAEKNQKIEFILSTLPEKYRDVLILKFLEGLSYDEISDVLKIPEGTVATRINRAKSRFKKQWDIAKTNNIVLN
jgi:RNA polymerase sigma-70 factor (ECF subfamily)